MDKIENMDKTDNWTHIEKLDKIENWTKLKKMDINWMNWTKKLMNLTKG